MRLNRTDIDTKVIMDDSSAQLSHQNGQLGGGSNSTSQLGGGSGGNSLSGGGGGGMNSNNKPGDGKDPSNSAVSHEQIYSIPGALHFIQHEFSRFEIERSQWDVDRAELQVSIHEWSYLVDLP